MHNFHWKRFYQKERKKRKATIKSTTLIKKKRKIEFFTTIKINLLSSANKNDLNYSNILKFRERPVTSLITLCTWILHESITFETVSVSLKIIFRSFEKGKKKDKFSRIKNSINGFARRRETKHRDAGTRPSLLTSERVNYDRETGETLGSCGRTDASFKSKISRYGDYVSRTAARHTVLLSLAHARSPTNGYQRLSFSSSSSSSSLGVSASETHRSIGNTTIPKARTGLDKRIATTKKNRDASINSIFLLFDLPLFLAAVFLINGER